jgi:hypothetical protein
MHVVIPVPTEYTKRDAVIKRQTSEATQIAYAKHAVNAVLQEKSSYTCRRYCVKGLNLRVKKLLVNTADIYRLIS